VSWKWEYAFGAEEAAHFWRVEDEGGAPAVHTYELDTMTGTYVATGIHRERLKAAVPFPTDIDLKNLVP